MTPSLAHHRRRQLSGLFAVLAVLFFTSATPAAVPVIEWSASGYAVAENAGTLTVRATRGGDLSGTSAVAFASTNGTAADGVDFTGVSGTLLFAPGESNRTVNIPLLDNASAQAVRVFSLRLAAFTNAVPGLQSNATVTILDDETSAVLDPWFDPALGANKDIFTLGLLADGRILVGGQFTKWNNQAGVANLIVLRPDGGTEIPFTFPNNTPDAAVYAVAALTNGFLIGGDFTVVGGTARTYLARMMSGGGLETNWVPASINNTLRALAVQPDGKILIAGRFTQVGGQPRNRIARLHADGSLDTSFAPASGANNSIRSLALQPDGRVLIGGQFTTFDGVTRSNLARLQTNGLLDLTFNPGAGADKQVRSVAVQADGKILIGGDFENYSGTPRSCVARLFPDGALDPAFDTGPSTNDFARVVAPAAGGKVWIGGSFDFRGGAARSHLALVDGNGLADSFVADAGFEVDAILTQPDGQTLVAGDFGSIIGFPTPRLARLNTGVLFTPAPQIQLATNQLLVAEIVGLAPLTVLRRGDLTVTAQVSYATSTYGNATAGQDYVSIAGTVNFAPLEVAKIIGLPIINDSLPEPFQNFELDLAAAQPPAQLGQPSFAIVTIADDDFGIEFAADTYATSEPEGSATITVRRGGTGQDMVTVNFSTVSGTALAGADFLENIGTLYFYAGETQKTFSVSILADGLEEDTETALLRLLDPAGTSLGARSNAVLSIREFDSTFACSLMTPAAEAYGYARISVQRSGLAQLPATVDYFFEAGTALSGVDFLNQPGTISFAANQTNQSFDIAIVNDGLVEGAETFQLRLANGSAGSAIGGASNLTLTVEDNDAGLGFVETNVLGSENAAFVALTVRRYDDGPEPLQVGYFTSDGTALAGFNYRARSGTLLLPASTRTNYILIPLLDECGLTSNRQFTVTLTNPSPGGTLGERVRATVTLGGNDRPGKRDFSFAASPLVTPAEAFELLPDQRIIWAAMAVVRPPHSVSENLVRLENDGSLDQEFLWSGPSFFSYFYRPCVIAVQPDGRILVSVNTPGPDGARFPRVYRALTTGSYDSSFQISPFYGFFLADYERDVTSFSLQPDGKILMARDGYGYPLPNPDDEDGRPFPHHGISRLLPSGALDPSFDPGTGAQDSPSNAGGRTVAIQLDGRILLGGSFTNYNGSARTGLARLLPNGQIDADFHPQLSRTDEGRPAVLALSVHPDQKILVSGQFSHFDGATRAGLARVLTNGTLDASFDPGEISGGTVTATIRQSNGRLVIGGSFTNVQGHARAGLARLNHDGSLDLTFDLAPDQYNVHTLALQADGRILVSGFYGGLWRVEGDPVPRVRELARTNGVAHLRLASRPGKTYALEASTNLVNWRALQTNTAADCALEFFDAGSPSAHRFYRAVQLSP